MHIISTRDEKPAKFLLAEQLGPTQSKTPEGYLLCERVGLARTGEMLYGEEELAPTEESDPPIERPLNGIYIVVRSEEDVFNPTFLNSLNGKPVVFYHPDEDVTPENWKEHCVGIIFNARRGAVADGQHDLIVGDLMITVPYVIEMIVNKEIREISLGYQAAYKQIERGRLQQIPKIANHGALVDAGRCGGRCAIKDHNHLTQGVSKMERRTTDEVNIAAKKRGLLAIIRDALSTKDEAKIKLAVDAAEELEKETGAEPKDTEGQPGVHIHLPGGNGDAPKAYDAEAALKAHEEKDFGEHQAMRDDIEGLKAKLGMHDAENEKAAELAEGLGFESPKGTGDKARAAKDSAYLGDSFQETVAGAEILAPGIALITYDQAASPAITLAAIYKLRKTALDLAYASPAARGIIEELNGGEKPDFATMKANDVRSMFRSAVAMLKRVNNDGVNRDATIHRDRTEGGEHLGGKVQTVSDLQKKQRAFWDKNPPKQAA